MWSKHAKVGEILLAVFFARLAKRKFWEKSEKNIFI